MLPARRHEVTRKAVSELGLTALEVFDTRAADGMGPAECLYGACVGRRRKQILTGSAAGNAPATT